MLTTARALLVVIIIVMREYNRGKKFAAAVYNFIQHESSPLDFLPSSDCWEKNI